MIQERILELTDYGLATGLITPEDKIFTINRLLELFRLDELEQEVAAAYMSKPAEEKICSQEDAEEALEGILCDMLDYAAEQGLLPENTITYRDLFDAKIMSMLVPRPSEVINRFHVLYQQSPQAATDYFYKLSRDTDYIRRYRIKKDLKWTVDTEFETLDITVNLSKPEKDPKAIAAAKLAKQSGYPKCLLCKENEGYAGRINHPARQNHRIIPVTINNSDWFFQYSPYVYYNEHCIIFNAEHTPMKIERATFGKLLDFVEQYPHYFVGSNADLPIVGGSILSHDHFQGGHYEFAMAKAPIEKAISFQGFDDVQAGIVKWPMSVIRIRGAKKERLIELADKILLAWRGYTDEGAFVFAETNGEPHNTITPIARRRGTDFELDLVLRNNITTEEHPLGVYHPHANLHHIKKENIGLIEVMGLAVLPARLKDEMAALEQAILDGDPLRQDETLEKHADWIEEILPKYGFTPGSGLEGEITPEKLHEIIQTEIGLVFLEVLKDAGVYKCTEEGRAAFERFIAYVNER
jgi:UDPglucose--hexose-1-phosphate uridylyltransferase